VRSTHRQFVRNYQTLLLAVRRARSSPSNGSVALKPLQLGWSAGLLP
jgi:hypothetical protein